MADMNSAEINVKGQDPTLKDLLDLLKRDIFLTLKCHDIGTIQSFDKTTQTATVTINYQKTYMRPNPHGIYAPTQVSYPVLMQVPVFILGGGGGHLTFPFKGQEECLILYNDRDIDNWFNSGQVGPAASSRLHSISDAIAIVGIRSMANVISDYDDENVVLKVPSKFQLTNGTKSLNDLFQDLVTAIKGLKIDVAGIGPLNGTINAASVEALTSLATEIEGLLQ